MAFLQLTKVNLAFGARDILVDAALYLKSGSRVALTGVNGAGKSTLIKVMAGLQEADSGEVALEKGAVVAYLPQSGLTHKGLTLLEEAEKAFAWGYALQQKIDEAKDIDTQSQLIEELNSSTFPRRAAIIEQTLLGLGFSKEDFAKKCETFSGGWQMRIALAKVLMERASILLLDEPTNYLDIEARTFLEDFLLDFANDGGAFLLVSHDRYFLDTTCNEVYELFNGAVKKYRGNYSDYEKLRAAELETLQAEWKKQQTEIADLQSFINRFGAKATKAAQAQDRQKRLDKLLANPIIIPESLKVMHFKFPPCPHSPNVVVMLNNLSKTYPTFNGAGEHTVIDNLTLTVGCGERLVVVGKNGAGKSTLLRIIAGVDKSYSGEMKLGNGVKVGYFDQDSANLVSSNAGEGATVLEFIENKAPFSLVPKVRDMLGAFLFRGDDVQKHIGVLSGGERTRLALLLLLLSENNLLILDEATNHLDLQSKDILMDAIKDYGGTVIFVSHDRSFMEGLATQVLELQHEETGLFKHKVFVGGYAYYASQVAKSAPACQKNDAPKNAAEPVKKAGLSYEEKKAQEAAARKQQKAIASIEEQIAALEQEKKTLEDSLALPQVYANAQKARETQLLIEKKASQIAAKEAEWEKAMEATE